MVALYHPDGHEVYRYRSRDFADRPPDDDLIDALTKLRLAPVTLGPAEAAGEPVEEDVALPVDAFGPYFRGVHFGTRSLSGRLSDAADRGEAQAMSAMAARFIDAWKQRQSASDQRG